MAVTINGTTGITTPGVTNSGAETIASTLAVTGATTLTGAATLSSTASIAGNVTLGSSLLATPSGSAPSYTCRAWVNFNGTGTVAIRASGNVSSITDNGTGDYTVNLTTAMPDANYCVTTTAEVVADQGSSYQFGLRTTTNTSTAPTTKTTTAVRLLSRRESDQDLENCNVAIFR